ncbi:MAG TPA: hypothetical protein DIU15_13710, partial [Deltaproteobacteria bacterium]|nr:hypothetical protein [Deltaproteobacteria bacterium]
AFDLITGRRGLGARIRTLVGPSYWASIFNPTFGPDNAIPSLVYALLQAGWVALALGIGWRSVRGAAEANQSKELSSTAPIPLVASLLTLSYALLFVLMAPYRGEVPPPPPVPANGLRYLVPLVPLVALCAGPAVMRGLRAGQRMRAFTAVALLAFLTPGAIAAVDSVEVRWLSSEPLYRPAIDVTTVLGRTRWDAPSVSELAATGAVDQPLSSAPRHRFARRAHLHAYGEALAQRVTPNVTAGELQGVLRAIEALPEDEGLVLYEAIVRGLAPVIPAPPWEPPSGPFGQLVSAALAPDTGDAHRQLWRAALNRGRDSFWDLHLRLT